MVVMLAQVGPVRGSLWVRYPQLSVPYHHGDTIQEAITCGQKGERMRAWPIVGADGVSSKTETKNI